MACVTLQNIACELEKAHLSASCSGPETCVSGATADSRTTLPNNLFICKGAAFKLAYLTSALERGAAAYLCDCAHEPELTAAHPDVPHIVVDDIRRAMAVASAAAFGHPERKLTLVGVTGTKGKTTTTALTRSLLEALFKKPVCAIGTHEVFDGVLAAASANTTPEAPELYATLARAAENNVDTAVIEVSSQALKYERTYGLHFAVGAFLNISPDHISPTEHPTFEDYEASKQKLFAQSKKSLVNVQFSNLAPTDVTTYGIDKGDLQAHRIQTNGLKSHFEVSGLGFSQAEITLGLPGEFNVENALSALGIVRLLGVSTQKIAQTASSVFENVSISGRMELTTSKDGRITVAVDYAHNETSFAQFFETMKRAFPASRVIALFGACGDRALNRIQELPRKAAAYADEIVLTLDEPGPMEPDEILGAMKEAIPNFSHAHLISDRDQARKYAFNLAEACEGPALVCFLGKGDEDSMHVKERVLPLVPDTEVAKTLISKYDSAH